jgi:protocatechuate 3,4-dioxygenase beta subunit
MTRIFCWAVLVAASLAAQVAPEEPADDGSIEGTVINEVTRDPVRKAQVTMVPGNMPPAVTDAEGHFAFRKLPPGTYVLHAQHPEYPLMESGVVAMSPLSVTLTSHENKEGLVMALTPGASVSGRVMDQDGKPVAGCNVQTMQFAPGSPGSRLYGNHTATSDDRGEYRIYGLARGHYYVSVLCGQPLPVAHGLVRSGPDTDPAEQRYGMQFYSDSQDPSGASRLMVGAGANVTGIDFHLRTTATVNLRGRVSGPADALNLGPHIELVSRDPMLAGIVRYPANVTPRTGAFRIPAVPPGAYLLVASARDQQNSYQASMPVDIGADPPQTVDVALIPGGTFTGALEIEGDPPKPAAENLHVRLAPLDAEFSGQGPAAKVEPDATFVLSGVVAGRWCLRMDNVQAYVKSLSVAGQELHSCVFNVVPGMGGTMRVAASTKLAQIEGMVNGIELRQADNALVILAPEDPEALETRTVRTGPDGHFRLAGIVPGRYRLYAAAGNEGVALERSSRVLQALEVRSTRAEPEAGSRLTLQVDLIGGEEIRQAFQEVE